MPKSRNESRLDEIESELTPKEWGIRLADEIRSYPNPHDFLSAIVKGSFHTSPYIRPYLALSGQSELRYPGKKVEELNARFKLNRKLRTEFLALKLLIHDINKETVIEGEKYRLRAAILSEQLSSLIFREYIVQASARTAALIDRQVVTDADDEWRQASDELASVLLTAGSRTCRFSLAREWALDAGTLLMEIFAHKAAVQIIQEGRFDGHPVLHPNIEDTLESVVTMIRINLFNYYLELTSGISTDLAQAPPANQIPVPEQKMSSLRLDAEGIAEESKKLRAQGVATMWENRAKNKAVADILAETGEHADFVWKHLFDELGVEPENRE
jgi:hypothetical protein